jgi:hypothetical protein
MAIGLGKRRSCDRWRDAVRRDQARIRVAVIQFESTVAPGRISTSVVCDALRFPPLAVPHDRLLLVNAQ